MGTTRRAKKLYLPPQRTASQSSFAVDSPMSPWTAHQAIQLSSLFTTFHLAAQSWVDDFPNLRLSQHATLPIGFPRRISWVMTVWGVLPRLYLYTAALPRAVFHISPRNRFDYLLLTDALSMAKQVMTTFANDPEQTRVDLMEITNTMQTPTYYIHSKDDRNKLAAEVIDALSD
ncbi:MAG: hypothetical protein ACOYEG_10970 [Petrimonas sp.]